MQQRRNGRSKYTCEQFERMYWNTKLSRTIYKQVLPLSQLNEALCIQHEGADMGNHRIYKDDDLQR